MVGYCCCCSSVVVVVAIVVVVEIVVLVVNVVYLSVALVVVVASCVGVVDDDDLPGRSLRPTELRLTALCSEMHSPFWRNMQPSRTYLTHHNSATIFSASG